MKEYQFVDHLKEYMQERVKWFVKDMGDHFPEELLELKREHPDRLVEELTNRAVPMLRMLEDRAIDHACFDFIKGIRWARASAKAKTEAK